jgi:hypothetical protein
MSAGKGDTPRPVAGEAYRANYDAIFSRGKPYPDWICRPCGWAYGRFPSEDRISCWHEDTCNICGEVTACTEPRDFGHLRQWPL